MSVADERHQKSIADRAATRQRDAGLDAAARAAEERWHVGQVVGWWVPAHDRPAAGESIVERLTARDVVLADGQRFRKESPRITSNRISERDRLFAPASDPECRRWTARAEIHGLRWQVLTATTAYQKDSTLENAEALLEAVSVLVPRMQAHEYGRKP